MHTDKREIIIDAAIELFAIKGFEGSSIREIAQSAGVNLAMINYYFGSKEKLFEQIILHKAHTIRSSIDEILNNVLLSHRDKLEQLLYMHVERLFANRHFHRVIHQELMLSKRTHLQDMIVSSLAPNSLAVKNLIREGIQKGDFKDADVDLLVATFFGTVNYLVSSRRFCNRMLNRDDAYIPYEDEQFRHRVKAHLRAMVQTNLIK
ncbi:TetR/AcrR family transcriptional regulator [Deminuibacter soli]|uniref:TetR/AcrR family transcriptional regulator n=1 Tax=Deminuibacter soli TaxID=2291815 RepID=A0A3E1NED9_9BACT|nr:TetR family transcriptional regulator [Deminuibacter soli]RFM26339.1 TetR/AcrR family transcriptional regulator [Deminuibacter soli]